MNPEQMGPSPQSDPATGASRIQNYAEVFTSVRKLILEFGLIVLLLFGLVLVINQVLRPETILDPIEIPEDVARQGYTGIVVAEKLADVALTIQLEARRLSSVSSWKKEGGNLQEIGMNVYLRDIEVPGAPFSIRTITRFIRQELGIHSTHIRGEIVRENGDVVLTLRSLSTYKVPPVRISGKDVPQLFGEGGRALLRLIAPSVLVIHDAHKLTDSVDKENDYAKLVPLLEYCLDFPPEKDNTLIYTLWGSALQDLKRPEEAIEQYKKAITLDPGYTYAYNGWGNVLLDDLKRPEEAIEQYKKALSFNARYANAYNNWGLALHRLGRPEEAIKQYKKAISFNPSYADAHYNKGVALHRLGRPEEAIEQYKKATYFNPADADAYNSWGLALHQLGRFEEAIKQYQKAISFNPYDAGSYYNLGLALSDLRRHEEAIKQYQKAISFNPYDADTYNNWGVALADLGRLEEAIKQYQKTISLNPTHALAYNNWGIALNNLGRQEEAVDKFRRKRELEESNVHDEDSEL